MTNDKDIGRLEGKMELLLDRMEGMSRKIDRMVAEGCAQLPVHAATASELRRRIDEIESQVKKMLLYLILVMGGTKGAEIGIKMLIGV